MKTNCVSDIYGEQIQVNGQWFHAQRIFGKPASDFLVDQLITEFDPVRKPTKTEPDELVGCDLYRDCSSNEMSAIKASNFAQIMLSAGGWGDFPLVSGYVETLDANDVARCEAMQEKGLVAVDYAAQFCIGRAGSGNSESTRELCNCSEQDDGEQVLATLEAGIRLLFVADSLKNAAIRFGVEPLPDVDLVQSSTQEDVRLTFPTQR